jgi:hypothetical protein
VKVKDTQNDNDLERSNIDNTEVNQVQAGKHELDSIPTKTKDHIEQHLNEQSLENSFSCPVSKYFIYLYLYCLFLHKDQ